MLRLRERIELRFSEDKIHKQREDKAVKVIMSTLCQR